MSQAEKTKPVKLRAACNQCNSAKTKCSGERTGCNRCGGLSIDCIYAESRVGRVPGVRAKKHHSNTDATATSENNARHTRSGIDTARPTNTTSNLTKDTIEVGVFGTTNPTSNPITSCSASSKETIDFSFPPTSANDPTHQGPVTPESFGDVVLNWPVDENYNYSFQDANDMFSSLNQQQQQPTSLSPTSHGRSVSRTSFSRFSSDYEFQHQAVPLAQTPSSQQRNSKCVIVCSQVILGLEKYMMDELKALDLILDIVKRAIDQMKPLIGDQLGQCNTKCVTLFSTIMYQIVELLEAGCTNFLTEDHDTHAVQGFGAFRVNPRDQRQWRAQMIVEELEAVAGVAQKIAILANAGSNAGIGGYDSDSRSGKSERMGCYSEVVFNLKVLLDKVKNAGKR